MAETVFNILKITIIIAVASVFLVAINALIGLVGSFVGASIIGEIFALISMYLPFNAGSVFGAILVACTGILAFKVAKKIFDLTSWSISAV